MRRLLIAVLVVVMFVVFVGCNDTHSARCNDVVLSADLFMEAHGFRLECAPDFTTTNPNGSRTVGMTDWSAHVVYIWPQFIADDRVLIKVAQHELGHVLYGHDETTAELFSYCTARQDVGYALSPFPPDPASCDQFDGWWK